MLTGTIFQALWLLFSLQVLPGQATTKERQVRRPTEAVAGTRYLGSQVCASCHPSQHDTQPASPMGRALSPAADSPILRSHERMIYPLGAYRYEIMREPSGSVYRVEAAGERREEPILWAFGTGNQGQTYLFQHQGEFYESLLSYYPRIDGLDFTPGAARRRPTSLESALGRKLDAGELKDCFSCHSTGAVVEGELRLDQLTPGITCEGCHGPGEKHLAAVGRGDLQALQIDNPGKRRPGQVLEFCGSCHQTAEDVRRMGLRNVFNVRFQPYRLVKSRCYDPEDHRIGCLACHDPHRERRREAVSYDAQCLACHAAAGRPAGPDATQPACPVQSSGCVSCHMPDTEVPATHLHFADHFIRVVRPGERYPE